jgi:four helix bundle protein
LGESFRELKVWQKAVTQSVAIYALTENFPRREVFGLSSQLRRASVSVASNIAEGYGRGTRRDYVHFLSMARGSNCEIETQLVIAKRMHFGMDEDLTQADALTCEVGKMLNALMKSLRGEEIRS